MIRPSSVVPLAIGLVLLAGCNTPQSEPPVQPASAKAAPPRLTDAQKAAIDQITGAAGSYDEAEDVHKVTFPRNDVKVAVDGWAFQPFMGITSWAAFTPTGENEAMAMGDLTLFEDEVNPVMSVALDNGLEVTALHNHFFYDSPQVMFMHIGGHGTVENLAGAVRKALDKVAEIRRATPAPASGFGAPDVPAASSITAGTIDQILGVTGASNNGMYKATIGRPAKMHGREIGAQMGVNTWAAFAGSDSNAFVDGDFAMHEGELQPVLKSLRAAGIHIVAIHNHMIHDEPRFIFLHYWGKGPAQKLAAGVKAAIDHTGTHGRTGP